MPQLLCLQVDEEDHGKDDVNDPDPPLIPKELDPPQEVSILKRYLASLFMLLL